MIDVETGTTKHELMREEEEITCILLSPDDKHLITAHRNLLLKQWDNWLDFGEKVKVSLSENENETSSETKKISKKCTRTDQLCSDYSTTNARQISINVRSNYQ